MTPDAVDVPFKITVVDQLGENVLHKGRNRAGMEALQQIRKEYDNTRHIRDASHIYSGCKDLNEYLQKRAETKKQAQSIKVKTPPNKPGGFRL